MSTKGKIWTSSSDTPTGSNRGTSATCGTYNLSVVFYQAPSKQDILKRKLRLARSYVAEYNRLCDATKWPYRIRYRWSSDDGEPGVNVTKDIRNEWEADNEGEFLLDAARTALIDTDYEVVDA